MPSTEFPNPFFDIKLKVEPVLILLDHIHNDHEQCSECSFFKQIPTRITMEDFVFKVFEEALTVKRLLWNERHRLVASNPGLADDDIPVTVDDDPRKGRWGHQLQRFFKRANDHLVNIPNSVEHSWVVSETREERFANDLVDEVDNIQW